jgi:outer membrane protein OmpA-like peptidoglycan-associated protein
MRQALDTLSTYDVYGLLFDFDSAALRPETAQLVRKMAVMLQQIRTEPFLLRAIRIRSAGLNTTCGSPNRGRHRLSKP